CVSVHDALTNTQPHVLAAEEDSYVCASDLSRTNNTAILSRLHLPIGLRRLEHLDFSAFICTGHTLRTLDPRKVTVRSLLWRTVTSLLEFYASADAALAMQIVRVHV